MPIYLEKHKHNYSVCDNNILFKSELSLEAKALLIIMLALPESWEFSVNGLNALAKKDTRKIREELKEKGYLKIEQARDKGKIKDWIWSVYEKPFNDEKEPDCKNQQCGQQQCGQQQCDNSTMWQDANILNTNKSITNISNTNISNPSSKEEGNTEKSDDFNKKEDIDNYYKAEPVEPKPINMDSKSFAEVWRYIDSITFKNPEIKEYMRKWYDVKAKGQITANQLRDKISEIYNEAKGNESLILKAIKEAYLNNYFKWFIPKEYSKPTKSFDIKKPVETNNGAKTFEDEWIEYLKANGTYEEYLKQLEEFDNEYLKK